jgi:hypothetical protein
MNLPSLRQTVPLLVAALLGAFVSQLVPLSMQAHAQTTTNTAPALPASTPARSYGIIDTTGMKDKDLAASLSNAVTLGWTYRGSVGPFVIVAKKGN